MSSIRVVVDSSASLPRAIADRLGITVVPIQIQCGSESYRENIDLTAADFYRRLETADVLTTSQPTPASFIEAYGRLTNEDQAASIISLHVSARASGTCNCATLASREFPDTDIEVVDSMSVSMGLGFLAMVSGRMSALGKQKAEILKSLMSLGERLGMFAVVPTLTYQAPHPILV
ncbi:MAG: DegV family protein [Chloroflexota bacterium]